jgi:hypothetical protein
MKLRMIAMTAATSGCLIACAAAEGGVVGLYVAAEPPVVVQGEERWIFRIYAQFDSPNDRVNAWSGGGDFGPGTIQTIGPCGPGAAFFNPGGGGSQKAPYSTNGVLEYGTFMTIGVPLGQLAPEGLDQTTVIPGTPTFINGNTWTAPASGGGVYVTPRADQGRAD